MSGISVDVVLRQFLISNRASSQTTTGVPPKMLMFGFSRTSGLPNLEMSVNAMVGRAQTERAKAEVNDKAAKEKMEKEFNERIRAKESKSQSWRQNVRCFCGMSKQARRHRFMTRGTVVPSC